jgi:hypothetical protein
LSAAKDFYPLYIERYNCGIERMENIKKYRMKLFRNLKYMVSPGPYISAELIKVDEQT